MNNCAETPFGIRTRQSWWIAGIVFTAACISMAFSLCGQEHRGEFIAEPTEPGQWINRKFPFPGDISGRTSLARGDWLVLLADRRCPDCLFLANDFIRLAENIAAARSADTPRFCILEHGPQERDESPVEQPRDSSVVCCLSAAPSARIAPGARGILHLRDSRVVQLFEPTELELVLKVFGS